MKITPEYSEGQQAYRDGKRWEDNPYLVKQSGEIDGDWEGWHNGWVSAYAEWAEGRTDERT